MKKDFYSTLSQFRMNGKISYYFVIMMFLYLNVMGQGNLAMAGNTGFIDLTGTWRMKGYSLGIGTEKKVYLQDYDRCDFLPAQVPGTVRQALLQAGQIPDPYYGFDNEKSIWVESQEWWFCRDFQVPPELKNKHIDLVFEGTVFKGEVWLNGQQIGALEGMFNPRAFPIADILSYNGKNTLAVRLEAPEDARNNLRLHNLTWETARDQLYSIAQCMFAWDWAPHAVPIGIWQPVKLYYSGSIRIENPYIRTIVESEKSARLQIQCTLMNLGSESRSVSLQADIEGIGFENGIREIRQEIQLGTGEKKLVELEMAVDQPKLWWPNGMGEQNLYRLHLEANDGALSDVKTVQFGIRELKIVENEQVEEFLKSMKEHLGSQYHMGKVIGAYPWTFQINGKKLFIKGGNWIPCDHLLRLTRERYDHLLTLARDAHANLLRVWGGGLYETDDFYQLCDQYGILTWQEFLSNRNFANIDRASFLEGARAAVWRIRNHPSLTFYCGGNEFDPDDFGSKDVIDALEATLKELDPVREFHRASPYMGDDHHWGVWHGKQPYSEYRVVRPFRSEAGLNTFPVSENYKKFTPADKLWPPDKIFIEYHGEMRSNFPHLPKLNRYADEFGASSSIEEFIMKSQLYQAIGNEFNMEFCRANKFRNSGLLFWQYNDTWPCLSWSLVDWYGTPKPAYYYVKRASRPMHIAADYPKYLWQVGENFTADVFLLNDTYGSVEEFSCRIELLDIDGHLITQKSGMASAKANQSSQVGAVNWIIPETFKGRTFFVAVGLFDQNKRKISDAIYPIAVRRTSPGSGDKFYQGSEKEFYEIFSELNTLPSVPLRCSLVEPVIRLDANGEGRVKLVLKNPTRHIAYHIRAQLLAESESLRAFYDDNYLTLLGNEQKEITVRLKNNALIQKEEVTKFLISGWNCPLVEIPVRIMIKNTRR